MIKKTRKELNFTHTHREKLVNGTWKHVAKNVKERGKTYIT